MKTNLLALFLVALASFACQEDEPDGGEPLFYDDYFRVVDAETGEDWFVTHPNYDAESVEMSIVDPNGVTIDRDIPVQQLDGETVFGPALLNSALPNETEVIYYLAFDSQDVDTLRREAVRCNDDCSAGNYEGVSSLTYYYNGELMEYLDFRFDPADVPEGSLVYRLAGTNQTLTDSTYIMTFEKQSE